MTNNKQQTAVDWLQVEIDNKDMGEIPMWLYEFIEQAKEMEKEQMQHWFGLGMHLVEGRLWKPIDKFEENFNETYGGNK
ncbi:MAG: hypothetical protein EBW68_09135 [Actinobacteria bacterium]|nr:hypothetical protein [Actinomycetota bacterium]